MKDGKREAGIFPLDFLDVMDELDPAEALLIMKTAIRFYDDRKDPEGLSKEGQIIWSLLRKNLERLVIAKEKKEEAGALGGKRSGEARAKQNEADKAEASTAKQNEAEASTAKQNEANEPRIESNRIESNRIESNRIDTQYSVRNEFSKSSEETPEVPLASKLRPATSNIFLPDVLAAWKEVPGAPSPGDLWRFSNRYGRELLQLTVGIDGADYIQAIKNYAQIRGSPATWWNSNPDIMTWTRKHLDRFLPDNFDPADYEKQDEDEPETWESLLAKQEAEEQARRAAL